MSRILHFVIGNLFLLVVLLVALAAPSLGGYVTDVLVSVMICAIVAVGLDLLFGYTGQLSLGHVAFVAAGGYTSGILATKLNVPFLLALACAAVVAGILGCIVAIPALRLNGLYLGMATLAVGIAVPDLLVRIPFEWSGGRSGLSVVSKVTVGPWQLSHAHYYYFVLLVLIALALFARNLTKGSIGRVMLAIRDNPLVANGVGVDVTRYRTLIFAISGVYAGIGGSLQAHFVGFISAEQYDLWQSIMFLAIVIIGGTSTVVGPIIGAAFFFVLPEVFRGAGPGYSGIIWGLVMVLVLMALPSGLIGLSRSSTYSRPSMILGRLFRRPAKARADALSEGVVR